MSLTPLQRLQVNDGLLITADRWQIAHGYHQQRQKIHYESLHQSGIVSGLGVSVGEIPDTAPSKYRQARWLTIQPGLAIDTWGNPIVVATAESCYLSAQLTETTTIYVVLRHSDRRTDAGSTTTTPGTDVVQEAFQILEKNTPAEPGEVELCRVRLTPEATAVLLPEDVFKPLDNQLDLRYRRSVQAKPQQQVTVSTWTREGLTPFQQLGEALPACYPALTLHAQATPLNGDLTHLTHTDFCQLDRSTRQAAAAYLKTGGVLLVEADWGDLGELYCIEAELRGAVAAGRLGQVSTLQQEAEAELAAVQNTLNQGVERLAQPLLAFLAQEDLPAPTGASPLTELSLVITSQPFQFAQLPTLHGTPVGLYGWGGLLLLVGPLPRVWSGCDLPPQELRSAQELGINLLHFAARRRQLHQLSAPAAPITP